MSEKLHAFLAIFCYIAGIGFAVFQKWDIATFCLVSGHIQADYVWGQK